MKGGGNRFYTARRSPQLRDRIFYLGSFAAALLVLYPLWVPLATGVVLAYVCEGPANAVLDRWGWTGRRTRWAAAIACVSLVQILFIAPLLLLTFTAAQELVAFWNRSMQGTALGSESLFGTDLVVWLSERANRVITYFDLPVGADEIANRLRSLIEPVVKVLATGFGRLLGSTPELILFLLLSWMTWVYFLAEGKQLRTALLPRILPWPRQREILGQTLGDVLRQMVLASLALAIVQSLLVTLSLALAGIPKFLLWGALAFFMSFVPVVGTFPVMGVAAAYAYWNNHALAAVLLLAASIGIGLSDNLLRPLLMSGATEMGFFWLFVSLLGGVAMFGLPGIILGPWLLTLFKALHRDATRRFNREGG